MFFRGSRLLVHTDAPREGCDRDPHIRTRLTFTLVNIAFIFVYELGWSVAKKGEAMIGCSLISD